MRKELLIFGAGGYLGRGITETLLAKDYDKIYLFDFGISKASINDERVALIDTEDLTVEANVIKAFTSVSSGKDRMFFLYSTIGGFSGGKKVWETDLDDWNKMFNMNLNINFLLAKQFAKIVKESFAGSICFTAAVTGLTAESGKSAYGISKSALIHLVKTLALEGKEINLTVNALAPYIIDTPANREWMKNGSHDSWLKANEIGELIDGLFSNFNFVTGNVIKLTNRFSIKKQ